MNDYTQMVQFDWWLCLCVGLLLLVCGVIGLFDDIKHRKSWWRWVLDILAIIFGIAFVIWTV